MHTESIQWRPHLLTKALELFDPALEDERKAEVREALGTILGWYIHYRDDCRRVPSPEALCDQLREIASAAQRLADAMQPVAMRLMTIPNTIKTQEVFNRPWFGQPARKRELTRSPVPRGFADDLRSLADWAKDRSDMVRREKAKLTTRRSPGAHSLAEIIQPSPATFLMKECAILLAANQREGRAFYELSRCLHTQAEPMNSRVSKRWCEAEAKAVRRWLASVQDVIGGFSRDGDDGQFVPCVFPHRELFPDRGNPTIIRCLRSDLDMDAIPWDLLDGPGW